MQSSVISKSKCFIFKNILKMSKITFICICVLCVCIFLGCACACANAHVCVHAMARGH